MQGLHDYYERLVLYGITLPVIMLAFRSKWFVVLRSSVINACKRLHPTLSLIITVRIGGEVTASPESLWQEYALMAATVLESAVGL